MRKLLIVESPAKAKTISKYLSDDKKDTYTVVASVGHVRDLPKSNKIAIDVAGGFVPHYEISKGKEKVIDEITSLAKKNDEVLLATDPDREGEAIAWHIAEVLKQPGKGKVHDKIQRVTYHEITKEAIEEALKHPRAIDQNLRKAQEARRVLDRLVGYDLSGIIWKKVRYGLSAGRVQSPALRIIMEREREIRAFISHAFWVITADLSSSRTPGIGKPNQLIPGVRDMFTVNCEEEPTDKKKVDEILAFGKIKDWIVKDIKATEVKKTPRAPFITSTLQQTASTRLGFAPSRTMGIAQKLYEGGHITYMRTDSTTLSKQAVAEIASVIEKDFGKEYLQFHTFAAKSKNAQEAHEAIRPTHASVKKAGKNDDEQKLYNLIWARTVASQMKDANTLRTKILVQVGGGVTPDFSVNGSRVLFPGWMQADPTSRTDDIEVPKVDVGEKLNFHEIRSEEKQTEPPGRYSEAGLIKELEKRGIGRPSTYASIIRTIEDRGYVEKLNKALVPTDTGDVVSSFLEDNFGEYISDTFTADMEDKLDLIAEGKTEYVKTLKDFYTPFQKEKLDKATNMGVADPKFTCPICGTTPMTIKLSRSGKFLSCSRYPECEGALTMEGQEIKKDEPIGVDPTTGLPIFIKIGKYGPYVQLGERVKSQKSKVKRTKKAKGEKKTETKTEDVIEVTPVSTAVAKPRMASIPKTKDLTTVTLKDALLYLSLPKVLGVHPKTGLPITANIGMFGPYIVHDKDFRSLKVDDVYTIELPRALEILAEEKKVGRRGRFAKKK
jgi:DNA topoisomerase-1